jgi:BAR domain
LSPFTPLDFSHISLYGQLEQDFEHATNEYDYLNTALKQDMPKFMVLATKFIDPLFHSFFYMQCGFYPYRVELTAELIFFGAGSMSITCYWRK